MSIPDAARPIAIVGANTLRGRELRELFEGDGLAGGEMRLLDEDIAVGTLTRSGDEPAIIAAVDETSFLGARQVYFAGSAGMAERHAEQARRAGAAVIDLSEDPGLPLAAPWIPALDRLVGRPRGLESGLLRSPSAAAIAAASVAAALDRFHPARLAMVFLRPVSEQGQEGIDELEGQTVRLLSFQPVSGGKFDAQVAFNVMDVYGAAGIPRLDEVRGSVARDAERALAGVAAPAIQILQAPVFFSYSFTAYAEFGAAVDEEEIEEALGSAGLSAGGEFAERPTGMSVIGREQAVVGRPVRDPGRPAAYWLWGAADNVRVVAANAKAIGEGLG